MVSLDEVMEEYENIEYADSFFTNGKVDADVTKLLEKVIASVGTCNACTLNMDISLLTDCPVDEEVWKTLDKSKHFCAKFERIVNE